MLFLATFVLRTYSIPSASMSPTLRVGDVLLVNQFEYRMHTPQRGDIAVFHPPFTSNGEFIKRIVAVPGDRLRIRDGLIYVNGKRLSEPSAPQRADYDLAVRNYGIYIDGDPLASNRAQIPARRRWQAADRVPAGFYFVVGDNRSDSDDSHIWGFASRAEFEGRAFLTVWPLDRMRILR